ncbi:MAG: DJ-1 family protein, partial [Deltaproteobacteria bacterium]|nr:DJ-1 family protein [Deltaproteobacteria bacterium]
RRAGAEVIVASVDQLQVTASRGVKLVADKLISQCVDEVYDLVALPGGIPGAERLRDSEDLTGILNRQYKAGRLYGAICASPAVVLQHHGLLASRYATCHPAFEGLIQRTGEMKSPVVVDGPCITSRGAGTAIAFALTLVEQLYGKEKAEEIALAMVAD